MVKNKFDWLLSPWSILLSIIIGVSVGVYYHHNPRDMTIINSIAYVFLSLLQMCVVPLIVTAVTTSFAKLLMSRHDQGIRRIIYLPIAFIASMLATSVLGIIVAKLARLGVGINQVIRSEIGGAINQAFNQAPELSAGNGHYGGASDLLHSLVSSNVVKAAVNGQGITIIIFSVLLGLSLGFITSKASRSVVLFFDGMFEALLRLVNGLMYLLPLGLFALFAEQISKSGVSSIVSLYRLVLLIYIPCIIMTIICVWVIAKQSKRSWVKAFVQLREMMTIAFASSNGFSALPFGLNIMEKKLRFDRDDVNLLFPITISLNFVASCYLFSMMAIFMTNFYGQALGVSDYFIILVGSVLTSLAVGSIPAIASFSMIGILFQPLGLPIGTAVAILLMVSQAIDPIVTLTNVTANAMWVAVFAEPYDESVDQELDFEISAADINA